MEPARTWDEFGQAFPQAAEVVAQGMASGLHVGAQIYVSRSFMPLADVAVGEARPGVPLTPDSLMLWLSACKPLAAVAIAQLVERGLVEFDAPVARYVPEFATGGKESVTLAHVLTHTGGFRDADAPWPQTPFADTVARICATPLESDWVPGQRAGYHPSTGWFILAEVLQRIDGRAFSEYVRAEICLPLGMRDSWIGMPIAEYAAYGTRLGILQHTDRIAPATRDWSDPRIATACVPGGNGHGPIRELGWFYEALMNGGERDGRRILTPASVERLTRRHRVDLFDETLRHKIDWGYGVILNSSPYGPQTLPYGFGLHASRETFGHGGYQSSSGFCDPPRGLVVAVVFNGTPGEAKHSRRIRQFATALYADFGWAA